MAVTLAFCLLTFSAEPAETLNDDERVELLQVIRRQDTKRLDAILVERPKLLNQGIWDEGTRTLLRVAADERLPKIAEFLRKCGVGVDIRSAAMLGWDDEIRALAKKQPKGILPEHEWESPVYDAITHEHLSTVQLLLDLGDPILKEEWREEGHNPLVNAISPRGAEMVRLLLSRMDEKIWLRLAPGAMESLCSDETAKLEPILKLLLAHKPSVAERDWNGGTYLRAACQHGNVAAVRLLLQAGADPDGRGWSQNPARIREPYLRVLLAARGVLMSRDQPHQDYHLRLALAVGQLIPTVAGASSLTEDELGLLPPIHVVAVSDDIKNEKDRAEIAALLERAGSRWTFPAAVAFGKTEIVRRMLASDPALAKMVVYRVNDHWESWSRGRRVYDLRSLSVRRGMGIRPDVEIGGEIEVGSLVAAAERGHVDIVRLLLPLEQPKGRDDVPVVIDALRVAVQAGHIDSVRAILASATHRVAIKEHVGSIFPYSGISGKVAVFEAMAEIQPPTKDEASATLREASRNGHLAVSKRALSMGGGADSRDRLGRTALMKAAGNGNADVVRWLLEQRVDPNLNCNDRNGPLHFAAQNGDVSCIKALLQAKADPNAAGNNRFTPVMWAARNNHAAAISVLVAGGADLRRVAYGLETALHIAGENRSVEAVEELLKLGADRSAKNRRELTTLGIVSEGLKPSHVPEDERWSKLKKMLESSPAKK